MGEEAKKTHAFFRPRAIWPTFSGCPFGLGGFFDLAVTVPIEGRCKGISAFLSSQDAGVAKNTESFRSANGGDHPPR